MHLVQEDVVVAHLDGLDSQEAHVPGRYLVLPAEHSLPASLRCVPNFYVAGGATTHRYFVRRPRRPAYILYLARAGDVHKV